jgi:hypothetical protein
MYDRKGRCAHAHPVDLGFSHHCKFSGKQVAVKWCRDCGALKAAHYARYSLQTRVMWRRPQKAGA